MSTPQKTACDLLGTLVGLSCMFLSLQIPGPCDAVRIAACQIENPWIALSLFYTVPFLEALFFGRFLCSFKIREYELGQTIVLGFIIGSLICLFFTWDVYLRFGLFGRGCGNSALYSLTASASLPYLLGFSVALRHRACRAKEPAACRALRPTDNAPT